MTIKPILRLGVLSACAFSTACTQAPRPTTVDRVDLDRYAGRWYEVARIPHPSDFLHVADTITYTPRRNGDLTVVERWHECETYGPQFEKVGVLHGNSRHDGKLNLRFGLGGGDYWVLALDPDYRYAMIGTPDRCWLRILSRTPTLPLDIDEHLIALADRKATTSPPSVERRSSCILNMLRQTTFLGHENGRAGARLLLIGIARFGSTRRRNSHRHAAVADDLAALVAGDGSVDVAQGLETAAQIFQARDQQHVGFAQRALVDVQGALEVALGGGEVAAFQMHGSEVPETSGKIAVAGAQRGLADRDGGGSSCARAASDCPFNRSAIARLVRMLATSG